MASVNGRFEYPDDLTPGQSKKGGLHQNLYDKQGNLVGHGNFIPDKGGDAPSKTETPPLFFEPSECDCESHSQSQERLDPEEIVEALILLINFAAWSAPRLERFWKHQVLPLAKSTRRKFSRARKDENPDASSKLRTLVDPAPPEPSPEVTSELAETPVDMSSEEAAARLAAALIARIFSDEQMRILRNSRIEAADSQVRMGAVDQHTFQQAVEKLRSQLEVNPSLLTRESLADLRKSLAKIQSRGGPPSIER
jgi:hypothetical protein